mgnify:CR=1 FL=1
MERFTKALKELCDVCSEEGWGDPLNYGRSREIDMAIKLGHTISNTLAGADAYNRDGHPVEYKTTTGDTIKGTYNGISVQDSWEEQERYLREEKIGKYKEHYFAQYRGATILECWMLTSDQVLDYLLPKLKKSYESVAHKRDPRLGGQIPADVIRTGMFIDI